jgi:aryl-alcohol dehydrogenase-like predicted oxidoreductase
LEVVQGAIRAGLCVIDTATIYGHGFAEVVVGDAVRRVVLEDRFDRQKIMVVSKAGYLPHTRAAGPPHSIDPDFLRGEVAASRRRMGLETIDAYLLHNLEEQIVVDGVGWAAVPDAFTALEAEALEGHIGCYGIAAAEGFRAGEPGFHSLQRLLDYAREVGGNDHHFRVIELPVNLWRREAFTTTPYHIRRRPANTLDLAAEAGLLVLGSIPMGYGRDGHEAIEFLRGLFPANQIESPVIMALQFARSVPGVHVVLPGLSTLAHLHEAIAVAHLPRWDLG